MSEISTILVYMTAKDPGEARKIGEVLVRTKLAACINILESMHSLFQWQKDVQSEQETVLLAKTRLDLLEDLTAKVLEIHSYDCPCVIALPIIGGHQAFLDWIGSETKQLS